MDNNSNILKKYVFVLVISRTGSSSIEIALQKLGYKTLYLTPSRVKNDNNKQLIYDKTMENIKNKKPLLDNIKCDYNCFILGFRDELYLDILYREYPQSKFILTDRNLNEWIISYKRHQKGAGREILSSQKYTEIHQNYITIFNNFFKDKPNTSSCIFNSSAGDNYKKLCNFLNKKIINEPFPCINSNKNKIQCNLTKEEINK